MYLPFGISFHGMLIGFFFFAFFSIGIIHLVLIDLKQGWGASSPQAMTHKIFQSGLAKATTSRS